MKLFVILSIFTSIISCSHTKPQKIGVVDMKILMDKSVWGRKHQKTIRKELAIRERMWIQKCGNPLKKIILEINKVEKAADKTPGNLKELKLSKRTLYIQCERLKRQYHLEVEQINTNYAATILKKVKESVLLIAKSLHIDLVVTAFRGVVLYSSDRIDITDKVILALEESP
jgi:Skp family chaperone for outer membrane proteins